MSIYKMKIIVIGASSFILYAIYLYISMWWSALDTSRGRDRCDALIAKLQKEIDIEEAFAKQGAVLSAVSPIWSGKTCGIVFHLKEGSPVVIPDSVDKYISTHPEIGAGYRIRIEVSEGEYWKSGRRHKEKTYFWWKILY